MNNRHLGSTLDQLVARTIAADPRHADALLREAAQCLLDNEVDVARSLIRHVVKSTIGYAALSRRTGTPQTSLVRMFGPKGSPTAANLFNVLASLQAHNRIRFEVRTIEPRAGRPAKPRQRAASRPSRRAA